MLNRLITIILIFVILLSGCSPNWWVGDGRGDWTLDLCGEYAIDKINSKCIVLIRKNVSGTGGSFAISNYHITGYQLYEPYVCLEGIHFDGNSVSAEEFDRAEKEYYLFDTTDGTALGPLESYDQLFDLCHSIDLEIERIWIVPDN